MKLPVKIACAALIFVVGVFAWNRFQGLKAAVEMQDVNADLACTEAYVGAGQNENSAEARKELELCKKAGWKPPQ